MPPERVDLSVIEDWKESQDLVSAAELVSASFSANDPDTGRDAAHLIIKSGIGGMAEDLARKLVGEIRAGNFRDGLQGHDWVRGMRHMTRMNPQNPIAWVDLALAYTVRGKTKSAERSLRVALSLAPDNRFVLRSIVRFYIHQNRYGEAMHLLRGREITSHDPWMMATEIAASEAAGKRSKLIKKGVEILRHDRFPPSHISELASEVGTIEYRYGGIRKAKRLVKNSLKQPTENAVAQASWLARQDRQFDLDGIIARGPESPEALAWKAWREGNWEDVATFANQWFNDQPFSIRPALLATCVMCDVLGTNDKVIELGLKSLLANPDHPILLNNIAFAYASSGQTEKAWHYFNRINASKLKEDGALPTYFATKGFIMLKAGSVAEGSQHYERAIAIANERKHKFIVVVATSFYAMELAKFDREKAKKLLKDVAGVKINTGDPGSNLLADDIRKRATELVEG
ncbi:MAG: hypothetical protein ACE5F3_06145 [Mariprofundaceae bacterium]